MLTNFPAGGATGVNPAGMALVELLLLLLSDAASVLFGLGMAAAVAGGRLVLFFQMGSFFPGTVSSPANSSSSLTLDLCAGVRPSFACANLAFLVSSVLNRRSTRFLFLFCFTGSSSLED